MAHSGRGEMSSPSSVEPGMTAQGPRSLKMKRSLSRLFSSSSRKVSRSRPSSPAEGDQEPPPTPQLPPGMWPRTPKSLDAPLPPLPSKDDPPHIANPPSIRTPGSNEKVIDWNRYNKQEELLDRRQKRRADLSPSPGSRRQPRQSSEEVVGSEQACQPTELGGGTYLPGLDRKKSKTGLRMPSAASSPPHIQADPLSLSRSKSQPTFATSTRPATAGADFRPTGKRRRHRTNSGPDDELDPVPSGPPTVQVPPQLSPRMWPAKLHDDDLRLNLRSALPAGSSPVDSASTKRSSVLTKRTSVTELTIDPQSRPSSKADGMTVDDAIDMYIKGFDDGVGPSPRESGDVSVSTDEDHRRSVRIAEAMSDTMGSGLPSQRPSTSESRASAARTSQRGLENDIHGPPPLMPPTTQRDQYGFLKANNYIGAAQYDGWYPEYLVHQERRTKKWIAYMRESRLPTYQPTRFPSRSIKTQRYILKGMPPAWRGAAWFYYAGGDAFLAKHQGLYSSLVARSDSSLAHSEKESIERDLHRTFPDNIHFKPSTTSSSTSESALVHSLRRVLRAFATHAPKIGYCQSLNFIAGLLLLFLPEEKSFVMLHLITTNYLPGTHAINLEGANVDLWVLMHALKSTLPSIWARVGLPSSSSPSSPSIDGRSPRSPSSAPLPPISLCTTSWFMSLFIGNLPIESTLRVWDALFYDGPRVLFRAALAVFRLGEKRIIAATTTASTKNSSHRLKHYPNNATGVSPALIAAGGRGNSNRSSRDTNDGVELFQVVQSLPRGMLDANGLMKVVARRDGVTGEWVRAKRCERRQWLAVGSVYAENGAASTGVGAGTTAPKRELVVGGGTNRPLRRRHSIVQTTQTQTIRAR